MRLGVAFNPCLASAEAREEERHRLKRKIDTGLVDDIWLNTGVDTNLLRHGIAFARDAAGCPDANTPKSEITLFASALRPNDAQRWQFSWGRNGVEFGAEFLDSLSGMEDCTRQALALFREFQVQPLIESKLFTQEDIEQLRNLLSPSLLCDSSASKPHPDPGKR